MRKAKAIATAALMILAAVLICHKAAGEPEPKEAAGVQQLTWEEITEEVPQQIIETAPLPQQEIVGYIPSTEAAEGCISEAELIQITEEVGAMYDICPELLQALVERESTYRIDATNGSCKGLAQISVKWHTDRMERLGVTDIYEPYGNILVAADYLRELFNEKNEVYYVLMRYNMAIDTANSLYADGVITDYALSITERAKELERLHGK